MTMMPVPAALIGEILGTNDDIRVVAALHPLRIERVELRASAGATIAEIVDTVVAHRDCRSVASDFVVHLAGHPVEAVNWHLVRPKPGTTVTLRPVVQGFFAPIFAALSAAFAGFTAFIGGLGFIGKLIMAGLSFGVKLLLNALFAPRPPQLSQPKQSYSLTGSRNQAAPYEPVPVILGKHRVTPYYGALPYTESNGETQYLRLLFVWGYGPLQVEDIKIGETLLSSFDEVEVETRNGYVGDAPITLYPRQVVEEPLSVDLKHADGWQSRTTAENVNEISLDFVFPNGVGATDDRGRQQYYTVTLAARYRLVDTVPWTDMPGVTVNAKSQDTIRKNSKVSGLVAGQYEVEVQKVNGDYPDDPGYRVIETVVWTALRGFRTGAPLTFSKPLCITAIKIKATSQLNGSLDTLNGVVTSLVKSWNGVAWIDNQPSRNPADHFRHVLQGAANARTVADAAIDLVALQNWHTYCVANKWTFDHPRVAAASVFDTLADICAAGRAVPIFKDGLWSVVWDELDTPIVQMFTPRNSWGFEATHEFRELPHAWRIRFINEKAKWKEDERIVYDDGYTAANATRFEGIEFPGVTHPDLIWKHGRFHIAQLRLRPETYTLNVDFENLLCTRADRVRVAHDVMLVGIISGRVKSIDVGAQSIGIDELVTLESDKLYQIRIRLADGTFLVRSLLPGASGETTTLLLDGTGDLPATGDLFTFGEAGRETGVYRVLAIEPQEDMTARITLVDDAPGISQADTGVIPAFESNITTPFDPFTQPPSNFFQIEGEAEGSLASVHLFWTAPTLGRVQSYEIEYRNESEVTPQWRAAPVVLAPLTTTRITGLAPGLYSFRIRCRFITGDPSRFNNSGAIAIDTLLNAPPDVTNFRISVLGDLATLSWAPVVGPAITYEIRFVSIDGLTVEWNSATPLIPSVSGTSVQVPTMIGTYLIKAAYPTGVRSANAALVQTGVSEIAGLNVVEVLTEEPAFAGVKTNVEVSGGVLRLLAANVISKWETLSSVVSMAEGDGDPDSVGVAVSGSYEFAEILDLGDVFTSRVTALIDATGENLSNVMAGWTTLADVTALDDSEPEEWEVTLEVSDTSVDPILDLWSPWRAFTVGDITTRAFRFRLLLEGKAAEDGAADFSFITPAVRTLRVQIDMPDRVIAGDDLVVPAIGLDVAFNPPFRALHGIGTNDQDMATGDRKAITAKGPSGFHIQYFNSVGTPVQRTMDYVAKGYGSIIL
ncbi:host specificity factor TipJ family phage tail protein [Aminobacter carboxidus]|uniref:Fibronectin type-III domain-containing protein n=1 Tax=Aminobacter carboxidus TaxID=376165 RepID=A0ABR9GWQ1_9HYPH|nr:host specificity factor TipJ family phage tail protein [Aminobacter carboxidus]MBE1208101.1 hypothetical protein [Aminobacter carboxidus]